MVFIRIGEAIIIQVCKYFIDTDFLPSRDTTRLCRVDLNSIIV